MATPTTIVLTIARIPTNASTAIMTRRAVHRSSEENHENNRYRISDYAGGRAPAWDATDAAPDAGV